MISLVGPDRRILRTNPFLNQTSGYAGEEVAGRDFLEFVLESERQQASDAFRQAMAGSTVQNISSQMATKDGRRRELGWCLSPLRDSQGEITGVLMVGHDITELRHAQAQAMQSERLAAIGQMVAGLAHESGNALGRSQACLEMLALRVENDPAASDLVRRVQAAQDDLQRLHEEVRQYAAPVVLRHQPADLREVIRESWEQLEALWRGRTVRIRLDGETGGPCLCDRHALERVFRNILENSLDAAAGPVEIEVRCEPASWEDRPAVRIAIRDNGPGLTAEQQKRLFEPFFTTKTHGTGLGIPISRRIVEAHGGQIAIGDTAGPGTELVVLLPRG
jgi:PAS domain S-box-containing protein